MLYWKPAFSYNACWTFVGSPWGGIKADSEVAMPIVGDNLYVLPTVTAN